MKLPTVAGIDLNDYITISKDPNPNNRTKGPWPWAAVSPMHSEAGRVRGVAFQSGPWAFLLHTDIHKD